jgi:hypothetical protein
MRLKNWYLLFLIVPFTFSCLNNDDGNLGNIPTAYVSFYNGAVTPSRIKIEVDGKTYNPRPFDYGIHLDYWYFYTGERNFIFSNPQSSDQTLLDTAITLKVDKAYTFFMTHDGEKLTTLFTEDSLKLPESGKALIRLVHLSHDTPDLDLYLGGEETAFMENKNFMDITSFRPIATGRTDFLLRTSEDQELVAMLPDMNIREGRIYTLIIRGKAEQGNDSDPPIRLQLIRNYPNF